MNYNARDKLWLRYRAKARFVAGERNQDCVQPYVRLRPRAAGALE